MGTDVWGDIGTADIGVTWQADWGDMGTADWEAVETADWGAVA